MAEKPSFDFSRFLRERWGSPDKLLFFLHNYGHPEVRRPMVNQWFRRGSIPAEHFAMLLGLLKIENGKDVAVEEYLE